MSAEGCVVDGCERPIHIKSRQLCNAHYIRLRVFGDPMGGGMGLEDAADETFLHAVDVTADRELVVDTIFCKLVTETDGHSTLLIDVRKLLEKERLAAPASVTLAGDAEVGFLPLERVVSEVNNTLAVLNNVRVFAVAARNDWTLHLNVDVELPLKFFNLEGHQSVQSKQVKTHQPHARHGGGHYRDRVTSQLRAAA